MTGARGAPPLEVAARLRCAYGPLSVERRPPIDELVLTILSQSTTDTNRDRAWRALRERYPDWEDARRAPPEELEETIRVAGLAGQKSRAIRAALDRLADEVGGPTLEHLADMEDEEALAYLRGFHGVGVKTAACVLCFSLRRPVLPVDTHVHRTARRLGWLTPGAGSERAHRELAERVPSNDRYEMHLGLIALGRDACRPRAPRCDACPLEEVCPREGV